MNKLYGWLIFQLVFQLKILQSRLIQVLIFYGFLTLIVQDVIFQLDMILMVKMLFLQMVVLIIKHTEVENVVDMLQQIL